MGFPENRDDLERENAAIARLVSDYLKGRRWFRGKARSIASAEVLHVVPCGVERRRARIYLVRVRYAAGDPELYCLYLEEPAVAAARGKRDALRREWFCSLLLESFTVGRSLRGPRGEIVAVPTPEGRRHFTDAGRLKPALSRAEQSNTSIVYGRRMILKLYRRLEPGPHPDVELGAHLTARGFRSSPTVLGHVEYRPRAGPPIVLGILQEYIPNQGDAWEYTLKALGPYFARARRVLRGDASSMRPDEVIGRYLEDARLLGRRTGELHLALGARSSDPAFAPEAFSHRHVRGLCRSVRERAEQTFRLLRARRRDLPSGVRQAADELLRARGRALARIDAVLALKVSPDGCRIRCHGDYHLGQVLRTRDDFVITDFEGEVTRPLAERREKSHPLRDVAGMLRSFDYAAHAWIFEHGGSRRQRGELEVFVRLWRRTVSDAFLQAYEESVAAGKLLTGGHSARRLLLELYRLEKALYELDYELNNRPAWVAIPLRGLLEILVETQG